MLDYKAGFLIFEERRGVVIATTVRERVLEIEDKIRKRGCPKEVLESEILGFILAITEPERIQKDQVALGSDPNLLSEADRIALVSDLNLLIAENFETFMEIKDSVVESLKVADGAEFNLTQVAQIHNLEIRDAILAWKN